MLAALSHRTWTSTTRSTIDRRVLLQRRKRPAEHPRVTCFLLRDALGGPFPESPASLHAEFTALDLVRQHGRRPVVVAQVGKHRARRQETDIQPRVLLLQHRT